MENNNNWRKNNKETLYIMITFQLTQTISHIITSQRLEQNIFNNIFTDKFKELRLLNLIHVLFKFSNTNI